MHVVYNNQSWLIKLVNVGKCWSMSMSDKLGLLLIEVITLKQGSVASLELEILLEHRH